MSENTEKTPEDCEPESSVLNLGEYLTSQYEILRRVFSYLPVEDLWNAAQVCRQWKTAVDITKKERICVESFVVSEQKYKMSIIWNEASFCLSFCTTLKKELEDQVSKFLGPNAENLLCLASSGVIGTTHELSQIVQQKVRVGLPLAPKRFYITSLRFPDIPNVGIKTFAWREYDDYKEFNNNFQLPHNSIVKCLIILMIDDDDRRATSQKDNFITFLKSKQKEGFAVGGCVVDDFLENSGLSGSNSMTKYIVFYGPCVEAASTVLTADIKSIPTIENKIEKFRKSAAFSSNGVLFIFRCAGRQRVLRRYKPRNDITKWEAEAIMKNFPGTPVVGCFGYGEFGNEFPDDLNTVSPQKKFKGSEIFEYSFSTSLVYISFKK